MKDIKKKPIFSFRNKSASYLSTEQSHFYFPPTYIYWAIKMPTGINKQIFYYLLIFNSFFSNADFENFVILLLGFLSNSNNKTIAGIAETIDNLKDHSVLSKFLTSTRISTYQLKKMMRELFLKMMDKNKPVFLYLDDSLVEKAGKKVRAAYNYSVSHGKAILSNCFVFALMKNGVVVLNCLLILKNICQGMKGISNLK